MKRLLGQGFLACCALLVLVFVNTGAVIWLPIHATPPYSTATRTSVDVARTRLLHS